MAKKTKDDAKEEIQNYYQLNTDAVNRLVNADKDAGEIPEEEKSLVKQGFLSKVPSFLKALFIKYWFAGACCFFFYWGLGMFVEDTFAIILILGIAIGMATDLLTNNLFRFIQSSDREYDKWMLLPKKKLWTFFVNIPYALLVVVLVVYTYHYINLWIITARGLPPETVVLGVEPFLFGLFYLIYDLVFIGIKDLIVFAVRRKKTNYGK